MGKRYEGTTTVFLRSDMSEELNEMVKRLCDRCAKEDWRFDMTFTYDPRWTDKDYCYYPGAV